MNGRSNPLRQPRPPLQARRIRTIAIALPILVLTGYTILDRMTRQKDPPQKPPGDDKSGRPETGGAALSRPSSDTGKYRVCWTTPAGAVALSEPQGGHAVRTYVAVPVAHVFLLRTSCGQTPSRPAHLCARGQHIGLRRRRRRTGYLFVEVAFARVATYRFVHSSLVPDSTFEVPPCATRQLGLRPRALQTRLSSSIDSVERGRCPPKFFLLPLLVCRCTARVVVFDDRSPTAVSESDAMHLFRTLGRDAYTLLECSV
ncbi:hypothetical protein GGX14DRAFT_579499 [Mycena pura]|uniref:Uncharacterized protein n=1 Tax=Mycena pura TaxID=153505 RepID=A0AAD6UMK1_9AGAR|nr:hypothetical protein GGX14DRAFT_579499 [Mycena pura]